MSLFPYAPWLVWAFPIVSSLLVPLIARFSKRAKDYFAVAVCLIALIFAFSMVPDVYFNVLESSNLTVYWIPSLSISAGVYIDPLSVLLACLVTFFGLVITVYSLGYMAGEEGLTRYYFFMLLFIGSMTGLVMSDNFLQMFIFWEMVGLCSYSLISFWYKRPETVRSATKVFLMTRVGDACLLAGICILYVNLGSFSFSYIINNIGNVPMRHLTAAAFLMLAGAVAKSAQLPLHTWLYSAMEAPTSVSALLHSATMVKAGVYLIARLMLLFGALTALIPMWLPSILWIGVITAFIGATLALSATDIKGVAAYSTISQIGFMFAALGTASFVPSAGWFASLLHLVSHALFQGLDFLLIGGIIHATKTRDMRLIGGLRKAMPITFAFGIIVLLARAGIPPFISFFSKELIFQSVLSSGNLHAALILYVSTAITFAYTLRVVTLVYLREKSEYLSQIHVHEAPKIMLFSSGVLAVFCVIFVLFGNEISQFMHANVEIGLGEVFNPSTLIFLFTLLMGGFPVYLTYYRKLSLPEQIRPLRGSINKVLENGYFFDALYEKVIPRGVWLLSSSLKRAESSFFGRLPQFIANGIIRFFRIFYEHVEKSFFNRLPYLFANGVMNVAHGTRKYLDILADELLYIATNKTLASASKIRRVRSGSLEHYVAAALIGFLIILILMIVTMLR
ncbi:MAG: NADH-quinone oxidoreductase subunit L [Candidatus Bathyarchaeia archaeon]